MYQGVPKTVQVKRAWVSAPFFVCRCTECAQQVADVKIPVVQPGKKCTAAGREYIDLHYLDSAGSGEGGMPYPLPSSSMIARIRLALTVLKMLNEPGAPCAS